VFAILSPSPYDTVFGFIYILPHFTAANELLAPAFKIYEVTVFAFVY
jgi:hypothetical protein